MRRRPAAATAVVACTEPLSATISGGSTKAPAIDSPSPSSASTATRQPSRTTPIAQAARSRLSAPIETAPRLRSARADVPASARTPRHPSKLRSPRPAHPARTQPVRDNSIRITRFPSRSTSSAVPGGSAATNALGTALVAGIDVDLDHGLAQGGGTKPEPADLAVAHRCRQRGADPLQLREALDVEPRPHPEHDQRRGDRLGAQRARPRPARRPRRSARDWPRFDLRPDPAHVGRRSRPGPRSRRVLLLWISNRSASALISESPIRSRDSPSASTCGCIPEPKSRILKLSQGCSKVQVTVTAPESSAGYAWTAALAHASVITVRTSLTSPSSIPTARATPVTARRITATFSASAGQVRLRSGASGSRESITGRSVSVVDAESRSHPGPRLAHTRLRSV